MVPSAHHHHEKLGSSPSSCAGCFEQISEKEAAREEPWTENEFGSSSLSPTTYQEAGSSEDESESNSEDAEKNEAEERTEAAERTEDGEKKGRRKAARKKGVRIAPAVAFAHLSSSAQRLLETIPAAQFVGRIETGEKKNSHLPGFLDLFSGVRGVAEHLSRITGRWVLCYDIEHSPSEDLDDCKVKSFIESLIHEDLLYRVGWWSGMWELLHGGHPPCARQAAPLWKEGCQPEHEGEDFLRQPFCQVDDQAAPAGHQEEYGSLAGEPGYIMAVSLANLEKVSSRRA